MSNGTLQRPRPRPAASPRPGAAAGQRRGGPPPIDPRLRARRVEVARGRARRRLRRVVVVVVLVGLVAGAYGLTRSALLDVDAVRLQGATGARAEAVTAAVAIETGTPLVDVDPAAARRRIEALPWVAGAEVRRDWPGTVVVSVSARQPVARHRSGQALDAEGRFLGPHEPVTSGRLPLAAVPHGEPGSLLAPADRPVVAVLAAVPDDLVSAVASASVVRDDVVLVLTDGIEVRVGGPERSAAKFVALDALLEQADRATIATIDLRVPTSPSLTRRPGSGA